MEGISTYIPHPIDLTDVSLPSSLNDLAEALAENVHETWASERISDGWAWGPVRDDANRLHPCLVPYERLPESERAYDRETAMATLKLVTKLGYEIVRRN